MPRMPGTEQAGMTSPLSKTVETLGRIGSLTGTTTSASKTEEILPSPELYIMVNGKVTKSKVVW